MTTNLVEIIQRNLKYSELKKIDPGMEDIKEKASQSTIDSLAQAAIPAVLIGLYKLSMDDEGSVKILNADSATDSLSLLFGEKENQLAGNVATYSGVSANQAESHLENVADEALRVVNELIGNEPTALKLKQFMNEHRHNILVYLPASLNIGDLLQDESLDDRTNKMEGPVSNFMHKIENKMSRGGGS